MLLSAHFCRAGHEVSTLLKLDYSAAADIRIRSSSDGNAGIVAFSVLDEARVALLCITTDCITIHRIPDGLLLQTIPLLSHPRDFIWNGSRFFVRFSDRVLTMDAEGGQRTEIPLNPSIRFISRLKWRNGTLYALTVDGYSYPLSRNGQPLETGSQIRERIRGWALDNGISAFPVITAEFSGEIRVYTGPDSTFIPVSSSTPLGCMRIIGTADSSLYLEIQTILQQVPLRVSRTVARLSMSGGRIIDTFEPPRSTFFPMTADLIIRENTLYHALTTPESIIFYRLRQDSRLRKTIFPAPPEEYHYNDHLPEWDRMSVPSEAVPGPAVLDPISRSAIMENADKYVQVEWICGEKNTSNNEVISLPDGALIQTPAWVTVGPKKRTPYKWGGFTHVDIFRERIEAECYAGDVYGDRNDPQTVSPGDAYCVGVDCSGFVSRAWNQPVKHWTGSLPEISEPLESWSEVRPGDIADKVAGHVMLIVDRSNSGVFSVVHSNGTTENVCYQIKTLYDLSGYVPMKYAAVIEDGWEPETAEWTALYQNFPNPIRSATQMPFYLTYESDVTISVYNLLGQEVAVPCSGHFSEGAHSIGWDPGELPSGIYFYRLKTDWDVFMKKCIVVE